MAIDDLQQQQQNCPDLSRIIRYIQTGELHMEPKLARQTEFKSEEFFFKYGILHHQYRPSSKQLDKVTPLVK